MGEGAPVSIGEWRLLYSSSQLFPSVVLVPVTLPQGLGPPEPTEHDVPAGQMTHSSRLLRKPLMLRTVWLAWVPPGHGCGAEEPSTHR